MSPAIERWLAVPRYLLPCCVQVMRAVPTVRIPTCPSPNARQEKQEHLARKSYVAVLSGAVFKQAPSPIHAHTARTDTHAHANARKNTRGHVHARALVSAYIRKSADARKRCERFHPGGVRPLAPSSTIHCPSMQVGARPAAADSTDDSASRSTASVRPTVLKPPRRRTSRAQP